MNRTVFNKIYDVLKNRLESGKLGVKVYPKPSGDIYPLVVITPIENSGLLASTDIELRQSLIGVEINIYTTPKTVENQHYDEIQVSEFIQDEVVRIMENMYGALRVTCQPTPNIDNALYRVVMRYNMTISDYRNRIF